MENKKKLFLISVTGDEKSLNRFFQEAMLELLREFGKLGEEYEIEPHNTTDERDLNKSLENSIGDNIYEGYIVILDMLDTSGGTFNPNVMFEYGGIHYLNKPFVVVATKNHGKDLPFDVRPTNIEVIPEIIIDSIRKFHDKKEKIEWDKRFSIGKLPNEVDAFLGNVYRKYKKDYENKIGEQNENSIVTNKMILDEVRSIKELVNNTAEYIGGEAAAFKSLAEAVDRAEESLRTTRFANESIASRGESTVQGKFMQALVRASKREKVKKEFYRIICNNHPSKWKDIYHILYLGANGIKVFVRKEDYNIHFELVIVDKEVAFIHFYQTQRNKANPDIQRINSTLRIKGKGVCEELANIFDRLHHRYALASDFQNPSHTLLGIPVSDSKWRNHYKDYGCFVVSENVPEYNVNNPVDTMIRGNKIIEMFKNAFCNWEFEYDESDEEVKCNKDKVYMAAGIALIEGKEHFIEEMKKENRLTKQEYEKALEWFENLNH